MVRQYGKLVLNYTRRHNGICDKVAFNIN